ncbi:MAG TPA: hypothetical protein VF134_02615 [Candidatus Dormibacteraeota bacterium]
MKRALAAAAAMTLVACSVTPAPKAHASSSARTSAAPTTPAPSPTASRSPLPPGPYLALVQSQSTLAITTLQGQVIARQDFTPVPRPQLVNAGPLLAPAAVVASGRVWYIDSGGVVHSLSPDGTVREVTRVPLPTSQVETSLAVSPDAQRVMVMVVTLPQAPVDTGSPSGTFSMQAYTATVGGNASRGYHRDFTAGDQLGSGAQLIGWDTIGPLATIPTILGSQGGGPHHYNGARVVHMQSDGTPGPPLTDPNACSVEDVLLDGWYVCGNPQSGGLEVHAADGSTAWTYARPNDFLDYAFLSPDHNHLAVLGNQDQVITNNGPVISVPSGFFHSGWVNPRSLVGSFPGGAGGNNDVVIVNLDHPGMYDDLHLQGAFLGALSDSP